MECFLLHPKELEVGKSLWPCLIKQKIHPWQMFGHMYRDNMNVDDKGRI